MAVDPEIQAHREWLGYVQPVGVVVSAVALAEHQAYVNRNVAPTQQLLLDVVEAGPDGRPVIGDLPKFFRHVLRWEEQDLVDAPAELDRALPEYGETLQPTYAVPSLGAAAEGSEWLMLVDVVRPGTNLDVAASTHERGWDASPQVKFERLLRETRVPIGLLTNGAELRLVYAPRGETSGHLAFPVAAMTDVAGRPLLAAVEMLLCAERLFVLPVEQRLPAIVAASRRYQNDVSTRLAGQVLGALYELLRGFQAADDQAQGALLGPALREEPDLVYEGLLTVLLRLVFLLYAEDRDLMPGEEIYGRHYSVGGLFERLRADAGRHPDTMDLRYGAWAQLLSLFRIVFDGAAFRGVKVPARRGHLFEPDRFPFLEGRPHGVLRTIGERVDPPLVSDGVVWRVLRSLVVLDGERLSYRSLDVEQIGSVYETMMGFRLEIAAGPSVAVRPSKPHRAPVTVDVRELVSLAPAKRSSWLREVSDQKLTDRESRALAAASSVEEAEAAIERRIDRRLTPHLVPPGAMVLQPNEERRRSGSFYTPRSLTEPIVRTTLRPVLERLGPDPDPAEILALKVCDPAMGSGAFLVEACRQLADRLVDAWHSHRRVPQLPPDSDELLHARRLVARRCLYGVDRNPIAADLAKLSLWLVTLARDHAFTFLDHALLPGDSLVGLAPDQIAAFHWSPAGGQHLFTTAWLREHLSDAEKLRAEIRAAGDDVDFRDLRHLLLDANDELDAPRLAGDLVVDAFFSGSNEAERRAARERLAVEVNAWRAGGEPTPLRQRVDEMRSDRGVRPFHWQLELSEVFDRDNPGFDAVVGNPPFAGKNTLAAANPEHYPDWLKQVHTESHGNADLVAHFFRRAYDLLREGGCLGLIATNTIGQGDTRSTGLRFIRKHGGTIYAARKRLKWPLPGAAVVVSVVHVSKGPVPGPADLDGKPVERISAFLFHAGGDDDPAKLRANAGKSFIGSYVLGMGFTFDDTDTKGVASSIAEMERLIEKDPRNAELIFPYIGGEEVNQSPTQLPYRYVINFDDMSEAEARRWPDLVAIVEDRVKPVRDKDNREVRRRDWWKFGERAPALYRAIAGLERVLVISRVGQRSSFVFLPRAMVYAESLVVFALDSAALFAVLQSRVHEVWARFFGSSMKDDLRYTPEDCFETFPFPDSFETDPALEAVGREYYEHRAALMVANDEGLTKTYNRFHDPDERSEGILRLRQLHEAMDRAVLAAYGWDDVELSYEFLLDYGADEDGDGSSRRRKPWRYRWPDEVRDEVLARLLALNAERAEEERLAGPPERPPVRRRRARREAAPGLFGTEEG